MTPTATPSSPPFPTPTRTIATSRMSRTTPASSLRRGSAFTSPWSAALLVLGLLGLAISGTVFAFRAAPTSPTGPPPAQSAAVLTQRIAATPTQLLVRGQPMRWSQTEAKAVQEKRAGDFYNRDDYKAAMRAAQYNQKNGWSDDGSERLRNGTPLRNNQKRGGGTSACIDSFTITAASCGESGSGIGGGDDTNDGGVEFEEL
jgi:hypothetical protein